MHYLRSTLNHTIRLSLEKAKVWWNIRLLTLKTTVLCYSKPSALICNRCSKCARCKRINSRCFSSSLKVSSLTSRPFNLSNNSHTWWTTPWCTNSSKWATILPSSTTKEVTTQDSTSSTVVVINRTTLRKMPQTLTSQMLSRSRPVTSHSNPKSPEPIKLRNSTSSNNKIWPTKWLKWTDAWCRCKASYRLTKKRRLWERARTCWLKDRQDQQEPETPTARIRQWIESRSRKTQSRLQISTRNASLLTRKWPMIQEKLQETKSSRKIRVFKP